MALNLASARGTIEVVSSRDDMVTCSPEKYAEYIDSFRSGKGDESLLGLNGEPTRFVLKKVLGYEGALDVKDRQLDFSSGKPAVRTSFTMEVVKHALIDIKNPPDAVTPLVFKKVDGAADPDIIVELEGFQILNELYLAHLHATSGLEQNLKKK